MAKAQTTYKSKGHFGKIIHLGTISVKYDITDQKVKYDDKGNFKNGHYTIVMKIDDFKPNKYDSSTP